MLIINFFLKSIFNTLKLVYGYLFLLVTRIKNCLLYHAFTQNHNLTFFLISKYNNPCPFFKHSSELTPFGLFSFTRNNVNIQRQSCHLHDVHCWTIMQLGFKFQIHLIKTLVVATLALGSRPRQGLAKVWAKNEPESHISCSWECKRM